MVLKFSFTSQLKFKFNPHPYLQPRLLLLVPLLSLLLQIPQVSRGARPTCVQMLSHSFRRSTNPRRRLPKLVIRKRGSSSSTRRRRRSRRTKPLRFARVLTATSRPSIARCCPTRSRTRSAPRGRRTNLASEISTSSCHGLRWDVTRRLPQPARTTRSQEYTYKESTRRKDPRKFSLRRLN